MRKRKPTGRGGRQWLNETVWGASLTSLLSDASHEIVTVLLPSFLLALGAPAFALGFIEGISDGAASAVRLFSGYYSDKVGERKGIALAGYVATGIFPAIVAIASSWPIVLVGRAIGWMGKGLRGPPRDAILAQSVERKDYGKAFGFHRAGDTVGAILGPLIAYVLVGSTGLRNIFWIALIPGIASILAFWLLVKEGPAAKGKGKPVTLYSSLTTLPKEFAHFLQAVGVFGIADFSATLLVFFAVASLAPSMGLMKAAGLGVLLYALRNVVYAAASYPFGAWGDAWGRRKVLAAGYALATLTFVGFMFAPPNLLAYAILFAFAGAFIAAEDALENAVASELVEEKRRATGLGVLASVNGVGDLASSIIVGVLWSAFGFPAGFAFSAVLAGAGTILLLVQRAKSALS